MIYPEILPVKLNCPFSSTLAGDVPIEKRPRPWGEDISWHPERIHDHDLLMFLHATRSIAAFAKIYDNGATPDEGHTAASKDWITSKAIQTLHESDYDAGKAIQAIVDGDDFDSDVFKDWSEDDIKNFIKGLRSHGKNFFKIREEFLPEKETAKLIEFYYLWKKTPGAASNRPRGRRHRPAVMRRMKTAKGYSKAKEDPNDLSSCSEGEEPDDKDKKPDLKEGEEKVPTADEGGEGEMSPYYCRHCFTTSAKDWHHSGKDKILLCTDCRIYYKRYAELPCLDGHQVGPIIQEEEEEEEIVDIKEEVPIPPIIKPDVEINLNAIEQDSKEGLIKDIREPVEIKAEVPRSNHGILSPVATLAPSNPSPSPSVVSSSAPSPGFHGHPGMPPSSMPPSSSAQSQPSSSAAAAAAFQQQHLLQQQQQLAQEHQRRDRERQMEQQQRQQQQQQRQHNSNDDVQVLSERPPPPGLSSLPQPPPPPQPQVPREPSPPPKPDGSECHRSQSAIFTRVWNRGEGNSCSRTDMIFKPVPETKLYRKREERLRKAQEREENAKAEAAAKRAPPPPGMQPHPLFSPTDPFGRGAPGMHHRVGGGHFPPPPPSHISSEIERREQEQRRILSGGSGGPGGPPPPPQHMARQPSYPPGFGPAPPPPPPVNHHQQSMMEAERRRYQVIKFHKSCLMFRDMGVELLVRC